MASFFLCFVFNKSFGLEIGEGKRSSFHVGTASWSGKLFYNETFLYIFTFLVNFCDELVCTVSYDIAKLFGMALE